MSTPQVGDRVRATLGESVVVGTVTFISTAIRAVQIAGDSHPERWLNDEWQVEILPSLATPIPDVEKAMCADRDGDAWQCRDLCGCLVWRSVATSEIFDSRADLEFALGPLVEMVAKA